MNTSKAGEISAMDSSQFVLIAFYYSGAHLKEDEMLGYREY
jgi:hypothetical protein